MIEKIEIKNIASYDSLGAFLETDKKYNLIYGLNGSGKTTIARILAEPEKNKGFIKGWNNEKILVYNQDFVNNTFYEQVKQKGIFTIGEDNVEAKKTIAETKQKIEALETRLKTNQEEIQDKNRKLNEEKDKLEKGLWKIKTTYDGGDRVLAFCLDGKKKSGSSLMQHVLQISKSDKTVKSIDDLKSEAQSILSNEATKIDENLCQQIQKEGFEEIEKNILFQDSIIGSQNSTVAKLIDQLGNSDWVKTGLDDYCKDNETTCPFCQEKTLTMEVKNSIKNYFDQTYENKKKTIKELKLKYENFTRQIKSEELYLEIKFINDEKDNFKSLYKNLFDTLNENIRSIDKKLQTLSQSIILNETKVAREALNNFLDDISQKIKKHNQKIDNKEEIKQKLATEFWRNMRAEYDAPISTYESKKTEIEKKINSDLNVEGTNITIQLQAQKKLQQDAQEKVVNIDKPINNINKLLADLGLIGFEIKKVESDFYQLFRKDTEERVFKTLSEGEKNIISFLYFLEICKGSVDKQNLIQDKIIVIDDPVSSLSHNYVFNISQMIKKHFVKDGICQQIFVLTHNLYFFHELIGFFTKKEKEKQIKMFRVVKKTVSKILDLEEGEIQNDYQSYWQILKDYSKNYTNSALLANSMRNILEHFFGFIDKDRFKGAVKKIDNQKYSHFVRYIDRESHSDGNNINDNKDIDPELFLDAFKDIFVQSGYEKHHEKMME